jgi:hypothetical protein
MKLKVIKNCKGGKSLVDNACQSLRSQSTTAINLKNMNKEKEATEGSASLKATRLIKILAGPKSDLEDKHRRAALSASQLSRLTQNVHL